ncbi:MAG: type II secretion system protein [Planctomycetota bacterium]|jgi:prepilin-type N-terminal cleavage/methylation domain-containing protein/prepilin-type processing-associated H-X9-DG protein
MKSEKYNCSRSEGPSAIGAASGFTLVELLVVIAVIALLMAILGPAFSAAKRMATGAICLSNQRNLLTGWILYSEDHNGELVGNLACYDGSNDQTPWVFAPKDASGLPLPSHPAPASITDEDRFRGIRKGTLWPYVKNVKTYHCPGDDRGSIREPPRDCFRSYSISYAFGHRSGHAGRSGYDYFTRRADMRRTSKYYVFVEEEGSGAAYGENEGGWRLPVGKVRLPSGETEVTLSDTNSWMFYDPLASFHNESSTFAFADGHAERHKWTDRRTLDFIEMTGEGTYPFEGIRTPSPDNNDLKWLIEHFIDWSRLH